MSELTEFGVNDPLKELRYKVVTKTAYCLYDRETLMDIVIATDDDQEKAMNEIAESKRKIQEKESKTNPEVK